MYAALASGQPRLSASTLLLTDYRVPYFSCPRLFPCLSCVNQTFGSTVKKKFVLLLARVMGQYCFARWRLSSCLSTGCPQGAWAVGRRARGWSGGRHCTAGQYGYVPLGRHFVLLVTAVLLVPTVVMTACEGTW